MDSFSSSSARSDSDQNYHTTTLPKQGDFVQLQYGHSYTSNYLLEFGALACRPTVDCRTPTPMSYPRVICSFPFEGSGAAVRHPM
eukprot:scaffold1271_cov167-Amphora_coffeaeformis.AAC.8